MATDAPLDDCPLPPRAQRWNIACFVAFWALYYLVAPVTYIGTTHANLLEGFGFDATFYNLPLAFYQWMTGLPILVAWLLPEARWIRPLILISAVAMAAITAAVSLVLATGADRIVVGLTVIAHGALFGLANGVVITALWDAVRQGISTSRRGLLLGFTFGAGPLFACLGSLYQDALFEGKLLGGWNFQLEFPQSYQWMFAAVAPLLLLAGLIMALFQLPRTQPASVAAGPAEPSRPNLIEGLRQFAFNRELLFAVLIYVLVYSGGNAILGNVSIYSKKVLLDENETLGIQSFLRFGCKALAGALLGWLLAKASPRATLLATTGVLLVGMFWALTTSGWWFMATFGIMGGGELFGAYFPNYIATASPKRFVRLNMAIMGLLSMLIGFSAVGFGAIADRWDVRASFYAAAGILVASIIMIVLLLPRIPRPNEECGKA